MSPDGAAGCESRYVADRRTNLPAVQRGQAGSCKTWDVRTSSSLVRLAVATGVLLNSVPAVQEKVKKTAAVFEQ
jgi:hypothetical protein